MQNKDEDTRDIGIRFANKLHKLAPTTKEKTD